MDPVKRLAAALLLHAYEDLGRAGERRAEAERFLEGEGFVFWVGMLGVSPLVAMDGLLNPAGVCIGPGCERSALVKLRPHLCDGHYRQWKRGDELMPLAPNRRGRQAPVCKVPGCELETDSRDMCTRHYRKVMYRQRSGAGRFPLDPWEGLSKNSMGTPVGELSTSPEGTEG